MAPTKFQTATCLRRYSGLSYRDREQNSPSEAPEIRPPPSLLYLEHQKNAGDYEACAADDLRRPEENVGDRSGRVGAEIGDDTRETSPGNSISIEPWRAGRKYSTYRVEIQKTDAAQSWTHDARKPSSRKEPKPLSPSVSASVGLRNDRQRRTST